MPFLAIIWLLVFVIQSKNEEQMSVSMTKSGFSSFVGLPFVDGKQKEWWKKEKLLSLRSTEPVRDLYWNDKKKKKKKELLKMKEEKWKKNNKIASIDEMEFDVILMYANRMLYINIRLELGKMDDVFCGMKAKRVGKETGKSNTRINSE